MKQHLLIDKLRFRMASLEIKVSRLMHALEKVTSEKENIPRYRNQNPHNWIRIDSSGLYDHMECSKCFDSAEVALENLDEWKRLKETEECPAKNATHLDAK